MAEEGAKGSPLWWVRRLDAKLARRQKGLAELEDYYAGRHRLAFATPKFQSAFGGLFTEFSDNWCDLVVDATEERLNVEGFRLGKDTKGDSRAWEIWQANNLDAASQLGHQEALIGAEAYVLVWWGDDDRIPEITVEHASQMIVEYEPGSRRRAAALKAWADDDGYRLATLYLPNAIYKFRSRARRQATTLSAGVWVERPGVDFETPNPLGVVTVVPLPNRPRLLAPPTSEIAQVVAIQDAVNKLIADMLVTSEFTAAPQRWATGLEIPKDPETGQPLAVFQHLVDRLWTSKSKETEFGEFSQADLGVFVKGIEMLVQHIASRTRTPPHYFYLSGQFPSGESIKSAETGLVAKVKRKTRFFGEAWEEVIRLAFQITGESGKAKAARSCETIWADPESRTEGEHVDAVLKKRALGVPLQQLWADLGYSPAQIDRFLEMRREEQALGLDVDTAGEGDPPGGDAEATV